MSDEKQTPQSKIENLELNRETLQDLGETEQEGVKGGAMVMDAIGSCHRAGDAITCHDGG
jgi:hypothetical protein